MCYYLHCLFVHFNPIFLIYMLLVLGKAIILMWFLKREVSDFPTTSYEIFPFFRDVTRTFFVSDLCPNELEDERPWWPEGAGLCQSEASGENDLMEKLHIRFLKEKTIQIKMFSSFPPRWESWQWKRRWRRWQTELEPGRLDSNIFHLEFYEAFTKYKFIQVFFLHF